MTEEQKEQDGLTYSLMVEMRDGPTGVWHFDNPIEPDGLLMTLFLAMTDRDQFQRVTIISHKDGDTESAKVVKTMMSMDEAAKQGLDPADASAMGPNPTTH